MAKIGSLAEILEIKFYLNFPCQGSTTSFQILIFTIYTITIIHCLSIYTSMKHSLLSLKLIVLALNSLDALSDVRIKLFTLLF
jgi:hypothetical protein